MTTLLLCLALLAPQQPADSSRVQQLEERVEQLENELAIHETKSDSFSEILSDQRWTFGIVVSLFTFAVGVFTVVFGLFGWSIVDWRVNRAKGNLRDEILTLQQDMEEETESLSKSIEFISEHLEEQEKRIKKA